MATQHLKRVFKVTGMSCGHCQRAVDAAIRQLEGVHDVQVDLEAGEAIVFGNASDQKIAEAINESGYNVVPAVQPKKGQSNG